MQTRLTELLGIRYPIVQGGMQWVGLAELASAVSNAGGLGLLTALTQPSPEHLSKEIERCKQMTDQPFGVNITLLPSTSAPPYETYLDAMIAGGVRVLETAGRSPRPIIEKAKAAGITVIHKCTSVRHALSAERLGVDVISIDGFECAGHPGEDDISGMVLYAAAAQRLSVPVIASGGIADGRGMAAALMLGMQGVNMGTRFCATQEAPLHPNVKQALVDAKETDTLLIFRTLRNTGRVLRNPVAQAAVDIEHRPGGCSFEDIRHLVSGARGKQALASGNVDDGLVWAGQCVGLIHDIPTCSELLERMVSECRQTITDAASLFDRSPSH